MYVCHCQAVTDCTIRASIEAGATDLCSLAAECGAGTRCGGCHLALRQMLAELGCDGGQGPGDPALDPAAMSPSQAA